MTKELKWRLSKLPTPDEVTKLVNDKIITKEEARDILFNEEDKTERDVESLQAEIKFLRELVEKLAEHKQATLYKYVEQVIPVYRQYGWSNPYTIYCTAGTTSSSGPSLNNAVYTGATGTSSSSFSAINTF